MTYSIDTQNARAEQACSELRQSLQSSRDMVRGSQQLIALSESDSASADDEDYPLAN